MTLVRTRWAAIGAAVAITLGGGGIAMVSATSPADAVTFVPITPCRVIDTRPADEFNVGSKSSPVGPEEEHSVTAVGNSGKCTEVPSTATAVSMNVTALNATLPTFIAVYASGETTPDASNLNPQPGAPPTPNAVTTELSPDGEFTIFNKQGSVDVLADINGYYIDHHHDDRYYTKADVDAAISAAGPFAVVSDRSTIAVEAGLFDDPDLANQLTVQAPGPGQLIITVSGNYSAVLSEGIHPNVQCSLTDDGTFDANHRSLYEVWNDSAPNLDGKRSETDLAITRLVEIDAAGPIELSLLCRESSSGQRVLVVSRIIAQFLPKP